MSEERLGEGESGVEIFVVPEQEMVVMRLHVEGTEPISLGLPVEKAVAFGLALLGAAAELKTSDPLVEAIFPPMNGKGN